MKIVVRVPATTANLGPGFDSLGLALQIWNTITIEKATRTRVHWRGDALDSDTPLPSLAQNLVILAMRALFKRAQVKPPPFEITLANFIPIARGLGSSAAAIVGGLVAANVWLGEKFSRQQLLEIATEMEGHPDNVSAALCGGMTISVCEGKNVFTAKVRPPRDWRAVLFIPAQNLPTKCARAVLPASITREDAIYNIGRAALLAHAFAQNDAPALKLATGDRLHQPYRAHLVPGMEEFCHVATRAGAHGVALSGAGPSMIAFATDRAKAARVAQAFTRRARALKIDGATRVVELAIRGAYARKISS